MNTIAKTAVFLASVATAFMFCHAIGPQLSSLALQVTVAAFIADRWERRINAAITARRARLRSEDLRKGRSLQITPDEYTAAIASLPADHAAKVRAMMKRGTWPN